MTLYLQEAKPEMHFQRALDWFGDDGLTDCKANTFTADVHAPFCEDIREALTATFPMLWGKVETGVTKQDWDDYKRLCKPESPDFILNQPGYYAFLTYSMFHGMVVK